MLLASNARGRRRGRTTWERGGRAMALAPLGWAGAGVRPAYPRARGHAGVVEAHLGSAQRRRGPLSELCRRLLAAPAPPARAAGRVSAARARRLHADAGATTAVVSHHVRRLDG